MTKEDIKQALIQLDKAARTLDNGAYYVTPDIKKLFEALDRDIVSVEHKLFELQAAVEEENS